MSCFFAFYFMIGFTLAFLTYGEFDLDEDGNRLVAGMIMLFWFPVLACYFAGFFISFCKRF